MNMLKQNTITLRMAILQKYQGILLIILHETGHFSDKRLGVKKYVKKYTKLNFTIIMA